MTTEERGQEEQERRQKKRIKRILLPLLALWLAVQLGKCIYQEEERRLGYAYKEEQYMNRRYRKFGDHFHLESESGKEIENMYQVRLYSDHYPRRSVYPTFSILLDYWKDEDGIHYRDNYATLIFRDKVLEAYTPIFDEAFGKGQYTIRRVFPELEQWSWQNYGPETSAEEYLDTVNGVAISLKTTADFSKSDTALEVIRKRLVEYNWGLELTLYYYDQGGNEIARDYVSINVYTPLQGKINWEYQNQEMKARWEHAGDGTE